MNIEVHRVISRSPRVELHDDAHITSVKREIIYDNQFSHQRTTVDYYVIVEDATRDER